MSTTSHDRAAPTPRDVLGVPLLPPGAVTALVNRARAGVGRIHRAMVPPPVRILDGLFGMLEHRVLVALCELGVPDALEGPTDPRSLAAHVGADPVKLLRLLRFASTRGWVRIDRLGRVRPTRVTEFLRVDHPGGWRAWVEFAGGDEIVTGVASLTARAGSADSFASRHGAPFFTWMAEHPGRWAVFDRAMGAGGRTHGLALAAALDWSASRHVCDVGGGTGELLTTLVDLLPRLRGTVFDLPEVVARVAPHPRLVVVGGDAFRRVPEGFDTYLLVNVLHDWNDDDAGILLERVAGAARRDSRIVVVDGDRHDVPRHDIATSTDVLMAALTDGGRERNRAELAELGARRGLQLRSTTRLATGDLAHEFLIRIEG